MRFLIVMLLSTAAYAQTVIGTVTVKVGSDPKNSLDIPIVLPIDVVPGSIKCPASVTPGGTFTCTFSLNQSAPAGGYSATLAAVCSKPDPNNSTGRILCANSLTVAPAGGVVNVAAGATSGSFSVMVPAQL